MRIVSTVCMLLVFCLVWGANTVGGQENDPAAKPKKRSPFEYNPKTVVRLQGMITAISPTASSSLPEPVFLTMQTEDHGKVQVFLGPNWFVEEQGLKLAVLDRIEVTGSKIMEKGRLIIFAGEVKKNGESMKLRNSQGTPLWGSQKRKSGDKNDQ